MKLPSLTARTRSIAGSKVIVSAIIESRDTFVIDTGTVYGPPPTRNVVPGGVRITCAEPNPGEVDAGAPSAVGPAPAEDGEAVWTGACGGGAAACGGGANCCGGGGCCGGVFGTRTV